MLHDFSCFRDDNEQDLSPVIDDSLQSQNGICSIDTQSSNLFQIEVGNQTFSIVTRFQQGLSFQVWPSALTLIEYAKLMVYKDENYFKGKRIVEVGAGTGLVGIVLAFFGARVITTDLPKCIDLIQENLDLNRHILDKSNGSISTVSYEWGCKSIDALVQEQVHPDFIVGSDIIYCKSLFKDLCYSLDILSDYNTQILIAAVKRKSTDSQFYKMVGKKFHVVEINMSILQDQDKESFGAQDQKDDIAEVYYKRDINNAKQSKTIELNSQGQVVSTHKKVQNQRKLYQFSKIENHKVQITQ